MEQKFFHHRIKHDSSSGVWDKGIEVHETPEAAKGAYHAYLGVYAYGRSATTDYVCCEVTDIYGAKIEGETWIKPEAEA